MEFAHPQESEVCLPPVDECRSRCRCETWIFGLRSLVFGWIWSLVVCLLNGPITQRTKNQDQRPKAKDLRPKLQQHLSNRQIISTSNLNIPRASRDCDNLDTESLNQHAVICYFDA